jgi:hypothetical protein
MCQSSRKAKRAIPTNYFRELTFFMKGLVLGETSFDRIKTFMSPEKHHFKRVLPQTSKHFLTVIREHFHGQLTYASGSWENVDWKVFDFVGIDYYRDGHNKKNYREKLRTYFKYEKPIIILEFGCCTYQGAEDKGRSWMGHCCPQSNTSSA